MIGIVYNLDFFLLFWLLAEALHLFLLTLAIGLCCLGLGWFGSPQIAWRLRTSEVVILSGCEVSALSLQSTCFGGGCVLVTPLAPRLAKKSTISFSNILAWPGTLKYRTFVRVLAWATSSHRVRTSRILTLGFDLPSTKSKTYLLSEKLEVGR